MFGGMWRWLWWGCGGKSTFEPERVHLTATDPTRTALTATTAGATDTLTATDSSRVALSARAP